jgi:hypothetical protein
MEKLIEKVDRLLRREFSGAKTELEMIGEKVHGFLFWEGFDGEDQLDRQRSLWKILHAKLGTDASRKISAIFTHTPQEIEFIREESSRSN